MEILYSQTLTGIHSIITCLLWLFFGFNLACQ